MSDIKLFDVNDNNVKQLTGKSMAMEKSLQVMFEKNLETFLGVTFLATEYSTGKKHGGRIDTLGIDENYSPVIIEYKRSTNENVINQGLYYLDWLLDHKAEFQVKVMNKLGNSVSEEIDWNNPRLVCIAGDFTKYDEHAVQLIDRNIELYRYNYYDKQYLLLELVNVNNTAPVKHPTDNNTASIQNKVYTQNSFEQNLKSAPAPLVEIYNNLYNYVTALGDDVQVKITKLYAAFKRIKNFTCIEIYPKKNVLTVYVKADLEKVELEEGFSKDVSNIGHYGTGNLALTIKNDDDLEKAKKYIDESYANN